MYSYIARLIYMYLDRLCVGTFMYSCVVKRMSTVPVLDAHPTPTEAV